MMTIIVIISSGICFAGNGDGERAYTERQARIAELTKPIVYDESYPHWGFQAHSWITGTGSETVAHTQLIDLATGTIILEVARHCNYTDPDYRTHGTK
nr:hypothetical protein [Sporomusa silvacetica]